MIKRKTQKDFSPSPLLYTLDVDVDNKRDAKFHVSTNPKSKI
ncbi:hypothetical protein NIES4075_42240 [Tolypothrix sp. NIES-4075]|nr:hypothetical protein NIES4075_42240 [Tolypothrix sp. NIES-4075]